MRVIIERDRLKIAGKNVDFLFLLNDRKSVYKMLWKCKTLRVKILDFASVTQQILHDDWKSVSNAVKMQNSWAKFSDKGTMFKWCPCDEGIDNTHY